MSDILFSGDLIEDLGTPPWLADKVASLYSYEQLAVASLDDLMLVCGKIWLGDLKKITAHARIRTGANKPVGMTSSTELPQDSVSALYAMIGKTVVAWSGAKLTDRPYLVQVGSIHVWVQLVGIDLQMGWTRPFGSAIKILVNDPSSLYEFLKKAGEKHWSLSAAALLEVLIDFAEAYGRID